MDHSETIAEIRIAVTLEEFQFFKEAFDEEKDKNDGLDFQDFLKALIVGGINQRNMNKTCEGFMRLVIHKIKHNEFKLDIPNSIMEELAKRIQAGFDFYDKKAEK